MLWHGFLLRLPRPTRYTLGTRIDNLFTGLIEAALLAKYAKRTNKLALLEQISRKLDTLKYFTTLLWQVKGIDHSKYAQLAEKLSGAGKMVGGWIKKKKNPESKENGT